jgi:hypothetical protein
LDAASGRKWHGAGNRLPLHQRPMPTAFLVDGPRFSAIDCFSGFAPSPPEVL